MKLAIDCDGPNSSTKHKFRYLKKNPNYNVPIYIN